AAEARRRAERGATGARLRGEAAFAPLHAALASGGRAPAVERGVVILAPDGEPMAWAGRHRFLPAPDTAELRAVITPFYVSLEARRQTQGGGVAVGSVLLDAAPAVPDRERAVSAQFERAHGVTLRFYPARAGAPPHRVVPPRGVLSPGVGSAQRVGGLARRARRRAAPRRERVVAPRAPAALVEHGRRRPAGARGALPRALPRPRHRATC